MPWSVGSLSNCGSLAILIFLSVAVFLHIPTFPFLVFLVSLFSQPEIPNFLFISASLICLFINPLFCKTVSALFFIMHPLYHCVFSVRLIVCFLDCFCYCLTVYLFVYFFVCFSDCFFVCFLVCVCANECAPAFSSSPS